ncbi:MAG: transcription-repair coupling factor [Elusimicrobiota bacterium]
MNQLQTQTSNVLRVSGLPGGAEAWWLWRERENLGRVLALTRSDERAQELAEDFEALERWQDPGSPGRAAYFPEEEPDQQVAALSRWLLGWPAGELTSAQAGRRETDVPLLAAAWPLAKESLPAPEEFRRAHRDLRVGERLDRGELIAHLARAGYSRVDAVEQSGEMAVRGEVLDLWSPGWEVPLRALWPFDRIESLRKIDLSTQRSTDAVDAATVRPASLSGPWAAGRATLMDYLGGGTLFASNLPEEGRPAREGKTVLRVELGAADREEKFLPPPAAPGPAAAAFFAAEIKKWMEAGWTAAIFCHNPGEQERLEEILLEQDRSLSAFFEARPSAGPDGREAPARRLDFPIGNLNRGFLDPENKRAVLCNAQIFGRARRRLRLPKFIGGKSLAGVSDLAKGDYVVHEQFGVGRYTGLRRVKAAGVEADYLTLEYKGGDRVRVPLFEFKQVQKFVGAEGKKPKLSSLDTAAWERAKEKVKEEVAALARDLLARAAKRAALAGTAFPPDSHMEKEFGDSFLYELTPDQARAIREVKADMVSPRPMDRLVCGDVGYGKTEVAMRAAFKAASAGRQVAVLVPTTILAEQHGRNFRERFADYPISVAVLSRFSAPAEQKRIVADLRRGVLDIVVGTHRLLSPDVAFKNLGLIIVDEEHRFGVKQKERLAAFRDVVDVLALSATPIPRTLGSALGGLKAMSLIESPPEGRLPIATHVGPFDEGVVAAALEHELQRGGQVFYVHNRVGSLDSRRQWLEGLLKARGLQAKIGAAHGQMTGAQLEKIMWDFLHKKHDILLSTSIIESGLDIPSVNTLVVEEAEDFGLSQLYQLRGRVGRERQKAYCYLFHSARTLSEDAEKRLGALREFASLGAGFNLALRDLEIRGAGNLLGPQQHGFVNAVGIALYGRLLSDEIRRQRDGAPADDAGAEPALELPVSAYLPEDYMPSEGDRVAFYKRLLDAPASGLDALRAELEDRCGRLPAPAAALFEVAELRHAAKKKKAARVSLVRDGLEVHFENNVSFSPATLENLVKTHGPAFSFLPGPPFGMRWEPAPPEPLLAWVKNFLSTLD